MTATAATTLSVGHISYINTLPLFAGFHTGNISSCATWTPGVPTALNAALGKGDLDAATVSSVHFLDHASDYDILPVGCIASRDRVLSVNFYFRGELGALTGKKIAVTAESATSVDLLRVLSRHYWHVEPDFFVSEDPENADADGFLLIGDKALARRGFLGYATLDLAHAWYQATKLPFVFGVFAFRKALAEEAILERLKEEMLASLSWGQHHPEVVYALAAEATGLPHEILREYFSVLRYVIRDHERESLQLFHRLRKEL